MDHSKFNPSYIGRRADVLALLPGNAGKILDIGCSTGALGEQIKQRGPAELVGIEVDEQMAKVAAGKLDRVITGDIEKMDLKELLPANYFDCVIFADTLEHLKDPWNVLKKITPFLNDNGIVIASIPNVRHYSTIFSLLFSGRWPYRDRGIHDRAHLRFFTLKNIKEIFQGAGLEIVGLRRNYRIIEHEQHGFSRYFALPLLKDFITFQYLVAAKKLRP